jgi:hypothetical protein
MFSRIGAMTGFTPSLELHQIKFSDSARRAAYTFAYPDTTDNQFLRQLRTEYQLQQMVAGKDELTAVLTILEWTNKQWEHNGNNEPSKADALTILKEVKEGKKYRCVEYGIVLTQALQAIGKKARVVGLKTSDVETCKVAAGHVLAEVWLEGLKKWVLIDGQFNLMPVLNNVPLNSVELQDAIVNNKPVKMINLKGDAEQSLQEDYLGFVGIYLYYFDIGFDHRPMIDPKQRIKVNGNRKLMLVPMGAKNPTVFQREHPINYCEYTNSLNDFYAVPTDTLAVAVK